MVGAARCKDKGKVFTRPHEVWGGKQLNCLLSGKTRRLCTFVTSAALKSFEVPPGSG